MQTGIRIIACSIALTLLAGCAGPQSRFGEAPQMSDQTPVVAGKLLEGPGQFDGKTLRVSGTVSSVCAAKGCWLRIAGNDAEDTIFVKFTCPVDGRLIPMDAVGREVVVEGRVTVEEISEDEARHYAEDAGATAEEIAAIVGPSKRVRMASPGATVYGLDPEASN